MSRELLRRPELLVLLTALLLSGPLVLALTGPVAAMTALTVVVVLSVPVLLTRRFARISAQGISENLETVTPVEISAAGVSRRQALRHLGLGAAGLAVPVAIGVPSLIDGWKTEVGASPATGPGGRVRQWGMIIDLRLCDGCQSQGTPPQCTLACIEGHLAPEPMEWIEIYEAEIAGAGTQFVPTPCQQCESPPCVNVCPVAATFSTPEGPVLIDQERCIGCRMCMAACPYDRRFFNWGEPPMPPEALLADYSVKHQAPAQKGTVMKCDFCPEMARSGTLPFCVLACPNNAIYYGDLEEDIATNGRGVVSFSDHLRENNAYRLKEHLGTQPRVHYIPGHGEGIGRDPEHEGRMATTWPWLERVKGAVTWSR